MTAAAKAGPAVPTASAQWLRRLAPLFAGGMLIAVLLLSATFAGVLLPTGPNQMDLAHHLAPPAFLGGTMRHVLGTDALGRDVLARLLYGARISLLVGFISVGIAAPLGITVGLIAGYAGGTLSRVLMGLCDIQLAIPTILLTIAVITVLGPGIANVIVSLSIAGWPTYARLVRSETLVVVSQDYVEAARAIGAGHLRIAGRHVLRNVLTPAIVFGTFAIADMIILEATLSFLGLGVPPRVVTWGSMLNDGRIYIASAWWIAFFPGLLIFLAVLGINLIGDFLRDGLDPRLRNVL